MREHSSARQHGRYLGDIVVGGSCERPAVILRRIRVVALAQQIHVAAIDRPAVAHQNLADFLLVEQSLQRRIARG
jgi:hypothetical protein